MAPTIPPNAKIAPITRSAIDHGRTGAVLYQESYREERLYPSQQNVPALSSFFEQMDAVLPSFLNTLSTTRVRGSRILLK